MIPVVVFDVDDTLYPELNYIRSGLRIALQRCARATLREEVQQAYLKRFTSGERTMLFQNAALDSGWRASPDEIEAFVASYRDQTPDIELSAVVKENLQRLKRSGVKMAAITDGDTVRQDRKIKSLGLENWLYPIIISSSLGPGIDKRHPLPFDSIEQHFGDGHRFCYVGDNSLKDFNHPSVRGWNMIQMLRQERVHKTPAFSGAICVTNESALFAAVDKFIEEYAKIP